MPLAQHVSILDKTFDYIIVGGGTAGLTAAQRIAENEDITVLVLEAGKDFRGDPAIASRVHGPMGFHLGKPEYDWDFKTTPQPSLGGRQIALPRGKGLGGSSAINFQGWSIPDKEDINDWERLGNDGWNFERFIKYANKNLNYSPSVGKPNRVDATSWPTGGELDISYAKLVSNVDSKFRETLTQNGIPLAQDPIGGQPTGMSLLPVTMNGETCERSHAGKIYLAHHEHRANLIVLTDAYATRIVFDDAQTAGGELRAAGVEFVHSGETNIISSKKEVILSAGALKTPHILELSGIGRSTVLEPLGIPVKIDLPVGENVQEHSIAGVTWELKDPSTLTMDVLRDGPEAYQEQAKLFAVGQGLFNTAWTTATFLPFSALAPERAPSLQTALIERIESLLDGQGVKDPGVAATMRVQLEKIKRNAPGWEFALVNGFFSSPNMPLPGKRYLTVSGIGNHLWSRGTIHSTSSDPHVHPAFDPKYFEDPSDMTMFVEVIKYFRELATKEPLKSLLVENGELNPGPAVKSDEDLQEWLRQSTSSAFHTVGSASMLPRDKGGVVDSYLKVYGTSNLRVADVSIVPLHISAHTQATAYAIGEFVGDVVKGLV
ncbi:hypothetical protein DL96DRAFT_1637586 [Flagelloscypha sp. PMI_526]|nr:hypothetical protein DL96DRAFT_1637586 [Flagelloscypha sp. PMI_526]